MSSPCENCGSDIKVCQDCDIYNGKYAEQKIGKWIDNKCSCCGNKALLQRCYSMDGTWLEYDLSNYCPDCGAKMEGGAKE